MPISVTATEVARDFNGVMEKVRVAGSVTVFKNSRPIAQIIPIEAAKPDQEEGRTADMVDVAKGFIDEYADVFAELAK
ncbi:type II toxin-antitoxin system prevent-host-death family antitoxin [Raoultibacter phocaeensis]|uniref:type II toxin-antitoxin system prevent-host-death family antitoxin n=1 Tax=Raoultibacter phocaeensis TaxID=2479841 RepID=UPI00111B7B48|nr:type II toxin-antitoxin system prevent-host-death family antitoxin [Raoultibacter phocaeensis]